MPQFSISIQRSFGYNDNAVQGVVIVKGVYKRSIAPNRMPQAIFVSSYVPRDSSTLSKREMVESLL